MKLYRLSLYILFLGFAVSSCYEEPDFPVEPRITGIESPVFKELDGPDSLIIRVKFQDGDGDLGLSGNEINPEFGQPYTVVSPGPNGEKYYYFDAKRDAFDCEQFDVVGIYGADTINDTVKVVFNRYYNNFDLKLFTKVNGEFQEYNFRKELCVAPLSGRFPILKDDFSDNKPLEGIIEYRYQDRGSRLLNLFRNDTLKLEVQIRDRALHESNVFESEPFTLRGREL